MATMKDVAKAANVSIATVSNIINGKFTTRNDTYFRVQQAIQDLNYHPNFSARNLRSNKARLLGVILPKMNEFYSEIYDGIVSALRGSNMYPVLKLHSDSVMMEKSILEEFMSIGVSGIIFVPSSCREISKKYQEIQYQQIPILLMERDIPGISCSKILFDNSALLERELDKWLVQKRDPVLLRLEEDYLSEAEATHLFQKKYPQGSIIKVKPHKDYMFCRMVELMSASWDSGKVILATNADIANSAFDASAMMGFSNQIYALTGSSWRVCKDTGRLHRLEQNSYRCGYMASERIRECINEEEYDTNQILQVEPIRVPHKALIDEKRLQEAETIRILVLDCEAVTALEQLSVEMQKRSGCHFDFDKKSYGQLSAEIDKVMQGDCDYDILMIDKPWIQRCFDAKIFLNLGNEFGREIFGAYPDFVTKVMYENKFRPCCIPFVVGVQAIYYRSDLFKDKKIRDEYWMRYEVELDKPTNWLAYNRLVAFFTNFKHGDTVFAHGTMVASADEIGLVGEFLPRQWAFNGSMLDSYGHLALSSPANERALANLVETYGYTDPLLLGKVRDEELFAGLLSGKIPLAIGFSNHYHPNAAADNTYDQLIESLPLPRHRAMVGGYLLGISKTTQKEEACREFLKLVMSDYASLALMRMQGFVPTTAVYKNDYLSRINRWMELMKLVSANRCTREEIRTHLGSYIPNEEMDILLADMIRRAFQGDPIRELLEETEQNIYSRIYQ